MACPPRVIFLPGPTEEPKKSDEAQRYERMKRLFATAKKDEKPSDEPGGRKITPHREPCYFHTKHGYVRRLHR